MRRLNTPTARRKPPPDNAHFSLPRPDPDDKLLAASAKAAKCTPSTPGFSMMNMADCIFSRDLNSWLQRVTVGGKTRRWMGVGLSPVQRHPGRSSRELGRGKSARTSL